MQKSRSLAEKFTENIRNVECFEANTGTESLFMMKKHTPDFVFKFKITRWNGF